MPNLNPVPDSEENLQKEIELIKKDAEITVLPFGAVTKGLKGGEKIQLAGFGTFEVKKKVERISVNPTTKQRMLVPPKLVLTYKPSILLKEKFK